MKFLVLFTAILAVCSALPEEQIRKAFKDFQIEFNKTYHSETERELRYSIFSNAFMKIQDHNNNKDKSWFMKVNKFADQTDHEFSKQSLGRLRTGRNSPGFVGGPLKAVTELPESVDWRDMGVISPVKDQGACGSCWAMAAVEQLESYLKLSKGDDGELIELSVQQMVSCSSNPHHCGGTGGCSGSIEQLGYVYTNLYGLVTEEDYPYTSHYGGTDRCKYHTNIFNQKLKPAVYIRGYETLPRNNMAAVLQHLAEVGPLGIGISASNFANYGGGIFDDCSYDKNIEINHGVQLVGYGSEDGKDYWIIRNSWGDQWGEDGYIRVKREREAICGIDSTPENGSGCKNDGVEEVKVCGMCGLLFEPNYPIGVGDVNTAKP